MHNQYHRTLWLALLLLAFGLRLYAIDRQDIWGDEAFSIWQSRQPLADVIASGRDTNPPGHPLALALWLRATGVTPLAVRTLSALQGFLLVPVIFVLGRRAFGRSTGLLAALLTALSPGLLYHAQETRMYSQVVLLAALSCYFFLRLLEPRPLRGAWWGYGIASLAAGYTHYYAFFIIIAQNFVLLMHLLRRYRAERHLAGGLLLRWCGAQLALIAAYAPWILAHQHFLGGKASARFEEWTLATLARITQETLTGIGAGLSVTPDAAQALMLPLALAGVVGMIRLLRAGTRTHAIAAFVWIPVGIAWLVNPLMPFFFPRYLLMVAPAFYLLVAEGIVTLARLWRPLGLLGAATLLLGSGVGARAYYADALHVRGRYGQMMAYVKAQARPGDALLWANPLQICILEYYPPVGPEAYFITASDPPGNSQTGETLEDIAARHPRLWLVRFGNQAEYDPTDAINGWLATHGSKAHYSTWDGADLALYIPRSATAATPAQSLEVALGEAIRLTGYTVSADTLAPGDTLILTLYWRAEAPLTARYTVFTHLLDPAGTLRGQMDSEPQGGSLPTDRWPVGSVIQDNYALTLAAEAPPGTYTLQVGMYALETGARLPVQGAAEDRIILQTIVVQLP